jgi:anti-sigma factor RsiW
MVDCPRDDIRDLLPDLVHDQLEPEARARVEQHLVDCAECAAELELLRALRATAFATPEVDVDRIAAAVRGAMAEASPDVARDDDVVPISAARGHSPHSGSAVPAPGASRRPASRPDRHAIPQSWRIAAGIALVAAGAGGYALTRGGSQLFEPRAEQAMPAVASKSPPASEAVALSAKAGAPAPASAPVSSPASDVADGADSGIDAAALTSGPLILGDAVNELSESDMQALLQTVDDLQAMPDLEPHQLPLLASVVEGAL